MRPSRVLIGFTLAISAACASRGGGGGVTARGDSKTVTESELSAATQLNLYDYVAAERPRWLSGSSSMSGSAFPLVVFLDDTRLGSVQMLKTLTTGTARMLRYYEASAAQQKFTGRDIGPVIQVILK